jgi:hypothetical protein
VERGLPRAGGLALTTKYVRAGSKTMTIWICYRFTANVHHEEAMNDSRDKNQCAGLKGDGEHCRANAQVGSKWCFFHSPESADDRIAAARRGGEKGRAATLPPDTPDFPLTTANDASALIGRTINQLQRGEIDPKIATAVGYLVTVKIKATDTGTLERRIAAPEAILKATNQD